MLYEPVFGNKKNPILQIYICGSELCGQGVGRTHRLTIY